MTARGRTWERLLAAQHIAYRRDRRAVLWQTAPVRAADGTYLADGPVDFLGVLSPSGRAVALDAKEHRGARWPLSALADHQARDLEAVHLAGGVAGVALHMAELGAAWWVPWGAMRETWQAWRALPRGTRAHHGSGSLDVVWLDAHAVRMAGADWLAGVQS